MMQRNQTQLPTLPPTGFIKLKTFLSLVPFSKSHLYDGIQKGIYPPPVKISTRSSAWRVEDVLELIKKLSNGRAA